jgi:hypothetical protein
MIFSSNAKPKVDDAPVKLRHILADQVKPKVFDFDRNRYKEMNPKRKPGGPLTTSQLGDIAAMKKRAEVAAIPDVVKAKAAPAPAPVPAQVAEVVKKKGGRPRKVK